MTSAAFTDPVIPGLPAPRRGKIRDVYTLPDGRLLVVATDRISAFDSVIPTPIPDKGRLLTALSDFWFDFLAGLAPHHRLGTDIDAGGLPAGTPPATLAWLRGRSMLVKRAEVVPIECIARGYLAGSAWAEYRRHGTACGQKLPAGLREADELPEPIFTPSTKAENGHDENISYEQMRDIVGAPTAAALRSATLAIYNKARVHARERGVILADTKFEFGRIGGELCLIDEVLTPDSSRFWPAESWTPGANPPSFDKQFVRDWLTDAAKWNREPPAPALPDEVVRATRERYVAAYEKLSGRTWTAA